MSNMVLRDASASKNRRPAADSILMPPTFHIARLNRYYLLIAAPESESNVEWWQINDGKEHLPSRLKTRLVSTTVVLGMTE